MTDNLLQKLEEKIIALVTELDVVRKEANQLRQENSVLKLGKNNQAEKLQELISLLDTLEQMDDALMKDTLAASEVNRVQMRQEERAETFA